MHPESSLFGLTINWYLWTRIIGTILCVVILLPILLRWRGIPWREQIRPLAWSVTLGWIGAALGANVIEHGLSAFLPPRLFHLTVGSEGVAGFTVAIVCFWQISRMRGVEPQQLRDLGDAITPPSAFLIAFFKIGCLLAGCCYGRPTQDAWWAVVYPTGSNAHALQTKMGLIPLGALSSLPVFPVEYMESILMSVYGVFALVAYRKGWLRGVLMHLGFVVYTLWRFFSEQWFRGDSGRGELGPITGTQALTLSIFLYCFAMIVRSWAAGRSARA
ncbi:MAG: prolipoprotein diacylglyceryl transferase [Bdellovibrionales bacterium]|nr:prolipoprotein diacylglyceryl transferase [Bdellovibrionales bacterium]